MAALFCIAPWLPLRAQTLPNISPAQAQELLAEALQRGGEEARAAAGDDPVLEPLLPK